MADSIIPTGDIAEVQEFIANLRRQIEERREARYEKIQRIRQRAEADEIHEIEREYFDIEPLRRQMEAMILTVAAWEALKAPDPVIMPEPR